jgi:hypothetical protein
MGERIVPTTGPLWTGAGRGRTACATAKGRICCPVARATLVTGGPKLPLRATVACAPASGRAWVTTPDVRWEGNATAEIGRVKWRSGTAIHAGWR